MADAVWCVFQRLEGEECPRLAAVCASPEVAEALVGLSRREQEQMGDSPGEWSVQRWAVLMEEVGDVEAADRISHLLDPIRRATAVPPGEAEERRDASGDDDADRG